MFSSRQILLWSLLFLRFWCVFFHYLFNRKKYYGNYWFFFLFVDSVSFSCNELYNIFSMVFCRDFFFSRSILFMDLFLYRFCSFAWFDLIMERKTEFNLKISRLLFCDNLAKPVRIPFQEKFAQNPSDFCRYRQQTWCYRWHKSFASKMMFGLGKSKQLLNSPSYTDGILFVECENERLW